MATHQQAAAKLAYFQTIDGEMVPYITGAQAIRSGAAVLIGGLLVGTVLPQFDNY
jgi:predicted RecA/RadA family phage recombinase